MLNHPITVSSTVDSLTFLQKAKNLAIKLALPYASSINEIQSENALVYTTSGLQLLYISPVSKKADTLLFVDFVHGKNGYRLARNCTVKQPLAKAVGLKAGFRPLVFDGTAGLGSDGFVLASLGCTVTLCERSPILHALLEDGLSRAATHLKTADTVNNRINLVSGDSLSFLENTTQYYDTIYLDPMYPHRRKSALNKGAMRTIRNLVGDDEDCGTLLQASMNHAKNRVVVKRPKQAKHINGIQPTHTIVTKNSRFDIYLTFRESAGVPRNT